MRRIKKRFISYNTSLKKIEKKKLKENYELIIMRRSSDLKKKLFKNIGVFDDDKIDKFVEEEKNVRGKKNLSYMLYIFEEGVISYFKERERLKKQHFL